MNKIDILSEFVQLYITVIVFSAWDKPHDPGAIWSILEHM